MDNCKHNRLERNCYLCYLHRHEKEEHKTQLDTLYEKLSELQIRIAKLEQYKLLQDDLNSDLYTRVKQLEELAKERAHLINYKSYLDLGDRIAILEREMVDMKIYAHPMQEKVWQENISKRIEKIEEANQKAIDTNPIKDIYERFSKIEADLSCLMGNTTFQVTTPKTTGLTFEEALVAFKQGKKIKRERFENYVHMDKDPFTEILTPRDLFENDWEIIE